MWAAAVTRCGRVRGGGRDVRGGPLAASPAGPRGGASRRGGVAAAGKNSWAVAALGPVQRPEELHELRRVGHALGGRGMLAAYYEVAAPLISKKFCGELEKFPGDAIMAAFAPTTRGRDRRPHATPAAEGQDTADRCLPAARTPASAPHLIPS